MSPDEHVLVVDDNPLNLEVAKLLLKSLNVTVSVSESAVPILAPVADGQFGIVFLDIQMPDMDGFEAVKAIRDREQASDFHTPLIAMTAGRENISRYLSSGFDDVLDKPVERSRIAVLLDRWLPLRPFEHSPLLDLDSLIKKVGFEHVDSLLSLFDSEVAVHVDAIGDAVAKSDLEALVSCTHKLKGACAAICAWRMKRISKELHDAGLAMDLQKTNELLGLLISCQNEIQALVRQRLKDKAP